MPNAKPMVIVSKDELLALLKSAHAKEPSGVEKFVLWATKWSPSQLQKISDVLSEATRDFAREHLEGASTRVEIGPLTNLIDIRVERIEESNPLAEFLTAAGIELIRQELEPKMERAVHMRTRRSMDVYAMLLPYTVSITVGDSGPGSTSGEDDSLRGDAAVIRDVQQALSDCGYDVGQPDGIVGTRTDIRS